MQVTALLSTPAKSQVHLSPERNNKGMRLALLLAGLLPLAAQPLKLTQAWIYDTGDSLNPAKRGRPPALEATPVYRAGKLFISTPWGTVAALDASSGKEIWRRDLRVNKDGDYGDFVSRGVTLGERYLYTGTVDGRLVCLNQNDGSPCPRFGASGEIDLTRGLRRKPQWVGEYEITSPPVVFAGLVITGSGIADNSRADMASGEVRAFDAETGALRWTFHPLDEQSKAGGANTWSRITLDASTGLIFLPTGSASPDYYGGERPGDNRHANSVVAIEARTGKVKWTFQTVHHDIWDYDVASPPELFVHKGKKAIAVGSKSGHLFLLDRLTGKPLFPVEERKVPASDVEGETASPTQPIPTQPKALVKQQVSPVDVWRRNEADYNACLATLNSLRNEGVFTPPSLRGTLVVPGNIGGLHWGGTVYAPKANVLVTPVNDLPAIITLIPQPQYDAEKQKYPERETTRQRGARFAMSRRFFTAPSGTPCLAPPWGHLVGIHADTGQLAWKVKLGDWLNLGGPAISRDGYVFIGADFSPYLRAFDPRDGKSIGEWQLPTSARATPMTYVHEGVEYVAIAAGGHDAPMSKLDTKIVVFRIN